MIGSMTSVICLVKWFTMKNVNFQVNGFGCKQHSTFEEKCLNICRINDFIQIEMNRICGTNNWFVLDLVAWKTK